MKISQRCHRGLAFGFYVKGSALKFSKRPIPAGMTWILIFLHPLRDCGSLKGEWAQPPASPKAVPPGVLEKPAGLLKGQRLGFAGTCLLSGEREKLTYA
jgi:hypothetical protein